MARELLPHARIDRLLPLGEHRLLTLLPGIAESPAMARIAAHPLKRARLLERAQVQIRAREGYAFIDINVPCIVLSESYYRAGSDLDLYLDLLHELTHLRQLEEGFELWDDRFDYADRPTEIEAFAIALEEGRRLGMTEEEVTRHLTNPWMTSDDVERMREHTDRFLASGVLPHP